MPQLTIYLSADVAREVKRAAKRARKSVSAYLADLAASRTRASAWPNGFAALYGSCELPDVADPAPDPLESLA